MLGTFSFEPYFKSYRWFTDWSLEFLEIAFRSLSPSSNSFLCFPPPPLCSAVDGAMKSLPGHVLRRAGAHASSCPSSTARCLALEPPCRATRSAEHRAARAAATSPPRWHARCRGRRSLLSRARALQKPLRADPLILLLFPCPQNPERRRHPRTPPSSNHRRPAIPQLLCPR